MDRFVVRCWSWRNHGPSDRHRCATALRHSGYHMSITDSQLFSSRCLVAEQAREVCASVTFGAKNGGTRSVPPFRLIRGVTDVVPEGKTIIDVWNEYPAIIAQIEYVPCTCQTTDTSNRQSDVSSCRSMKGVENIEEICQVERVGLHLCASFLSVSMSM